MKHFTHDMTGFAMASYYILAIVLLLWLLSTYGKGVITWILNRLYDLALSL